MASESGEGSSSESDGKFSPSELLVMLAERIRKRRERRKRKKRDRKKGSAQHAARKSKKKKARNQSEPRVASKFAKMPAVNSDSSSESSSESGDDDSTDTEEGRKTNSAKLVSMKKKSAHVACKSKMKKARNQSERKAAGKTAKMPGVNSESKFSTKTKKDFKETLHFSSESEDDDSSEFLSKFEGDTDSSDTEKENQNSEEFASITHLFSESKHVVVKKFFEIKERSSNGPNDPFSKHARAVQKYGDFVEAVRKLLRSLHDVNTKPIPEHMYLNDEEIGFLSDGDALIHRKSVELIPPFLSTPRPEENPVVPFEKRAKAQAEFYRFFNAAIVAMDEDSASVPCELYLKKKEVYHLLLPLEETLYFRCQRLINSDYYSKYKRREVNDNFRADSEEGRAILKFYDFLEALWQLQDPDGKRIPAHMYLDETEIRFLAPDEYCFYLDAERKILTLPEHFWKFVCKEDLVDSLGKRARVQEKLFRVLDAAIDERDYDSGSIYSEMHIIGEEHELLLPVEEILYHHCLGHYFFDSIEDEEIDDLPVLSFDEDSNYKDEIGVSRKMKQMFKKMFSLVFSDSEEDSLHGFSVSEMTEKVSEKKIRKEEILEKNMMRQKRG